MIALKRVLVTLVLLGIHVNSLSNESNRLDKASFNLMMTQLSNWGRWGKSDELGALNLITKKKRLDAAHLVKEGISVSLSRNLDKIKSRENPHPFVHEINIVNISQSSIVAIDRYAVDYHGIVQTHVDALCHIFHNGKMYNGFSQETVTEKGCSKLGIGLLAQGVFTRGVLIDLSELTQKRFLKPGVSIYSSHLDAWEKMSGVKILPGDAILIRTGISKRNGLNDSLLGLHASAAEWLKSRDVAIFGTDYGGEISPSGVEGEVIPIHKLLVVSMGVPVIDNMDLEKVANVAKKLNRRTFLLNFSPMYVEGGTGSPVNPIAVF